MKQRTFKVIGTEKITDDTATELFTRSGAHGKYKQITEQVSTLRPKYLLRVNASDELMQRNIMSSVRRHCKVHLTDGEYKLKTDSENFGVLVYRSK